MSDWKFLTHLYKETPVSPGWLTAKFGRRELTDFSPVPKVKIVSDTASLSMATLGKVYDPPKAVKGAVNVSEMLVDPAQIYEYDSITEELVFAQNYNPEITAVTGAAEVLSSINYLRAKKLEVLKARVRNRLEWMYAQVLSTGGITYQGDDRTFQVDYGVTADSYALGASAKVVSDLRDVVKDLKANGFSPSFILVTPNVEKVLWDNTQFQKAVEKSALAVGSTRFDTNEPFASFVAQIEGLPPIFVYAATVDSVDFIEGDKIIVVGDGAIRTAYGAIVNANLNANFVPVMTDVAVWEQNSEDGSQRNIYVLSRPLPYLVSAKGIKILNVS